MRSEMLQKRHGGALSGPVCFNKRLANHLQMCIIAIIINCKSFAHSRREETMAKEYHSRYRIRILQYFEEQPDRRMSAAGVYEKMTEEGMHVNLATVYRNLDRLVQDQMLIALKAPEEEEKYYQYMRPGLKCAEHLHLCCSRCGKVIHLNCGFMREIQEHLMEDHGFLLDCGESMLTGLCSECRAIVRMKGQTRDQKTEKGTRYDGNVT